MKLSRLFAVPVIAAAMVLAGVTPAHAGITDMACNYDHVNFYQFNACLDFQGTGQLNYMIAHVGLDVYESQADAQQDALTAPQARLYGHNQNGSVVFIAELPLSPGWPAVGADGFGAEWSATLYKGDLNTNPNGDDALFVTTTYYHMSAGGWVAHNTGTVHGDFIPYVESPGGGGGGGGCLRACQ